MGVDAAGRAACDRFRQVALGAGGESMTEAQVVAGLKDVGRLAQESTTPSIRDNAQVVAAEANAQTMISGEANAAQDSLADACNKLFPLGG